MRKNDALFLLISGCCLGEILGRQVLDRDARSGIRHSEYRRLYDGGTPKKSVKGLLDRRKLKGSEKKTSKSEPIPEPKSPTSSSKSKQSSVKGTASFDMIWPTASPTEEGSFEYTVRSGKGGSKSSKSEMDYPSKGKMKKKNRSGKSKSKMKESKSSDSKGKGKGKGGKGKGSKSSSSKSSKLTEPPALHPTKPPTISPTDGTPTSPPPSSSDNPLPTAPPETGQPTDSTTDSPAGPPTGDVVLQSLTPYGLDYIVTEDRIPFRSEYLEVVELTRMYLSGFMEDEFEDMPLTELDEFLTIFIGSSFNFGEPIHIDYESSGVFKTSSTVIPTVEILDRTLAEAFLGENLNGYIGMLQSLPPQNVFSTTISVNQTEAVATQAPEAPDDSGSSTTKQKVTAATGAVVGAAGLALLAASFLYLKRQRDDGSPFTGMTINKNTDDCATVAGQTFGGMTFDQMSESQPFRTSMSSERDSFSSNTGQGVDEDKDLESETKPINKVYVDNPEYSGEVTKVALELDGMLGSPSMHYTCDEIPEVDEVADT